MSSVNAVLAIANQAPYVVSKGGINQLTKVMALFLASAESSYLTGQAIYPDGGRLALNYTVPVRD